MTGQTTGRVELVRLPAGQAITLHTAIGGLLDATLAPAGGAVLVASDTPGTSATVALPDGVPGWAAVVALRAATEVLTGDRDARAELERRHRELAELPADEDPLTVGRMRANPDGSVSFGVGSADDTARRAAMWVLGMFLPALQETGATNYLAWEVEDPDSGGRYEISVTKPGGLTPHQARRRAERAARQLLEALEVLAEGHPDPAEVLDTIAEAGRALTDPAKPVLAPRRAS